MPTCAHYAVCGRDALEGHDGKCILHSEHPEKDEELFEEALKKYREEHEPDFRWMVFPNEISCWGQTFETETNFRGSVFRERALFNECIFEEEAVFVGATFESVVSFLDATFKKRTRFLGANIEGEGLFRDAKFKGETDFRFVSFDCKSSLDKADFRDSTFEKRARFSRSTFKDKACFTGATFEGEVAFDHCDFREIANFEDSFFRSDTSFKNATFKGEADFTEAVLKDKADFEETTFKDESVFENATFLGKADFNDTCFGNANFYRSTFKMMAYFTGATFVKASFTDSTFMKEAFFSRAFQTGDGAEFTEAEFYNCEFGGGAKFTGEDDGSRAFASGEVSFRNVMVASDANLCFRYVDLSRCRFLRTDLRDVEFTGVNWCEDVSSDGWCFNEWFRRVGLYDEVYEHKQANISEDDSDEEGSESESTPPWSEIERLYRQLKRNYEDRGDFPRGGDFHIGEKVARRQNPQTHWGARFLLTAYRALSKYGERALPATFWLIGMVPALTLLYVLLGASTCPLCGPVSYPEAFLASLEATFYPVRPVGFEEFWPQLLSIIQRVVSPILLALLALALRQRVKR